MSNENISVPQSNIIAPTDFKYGDSDICSKRRKCNADDTEDNGSIAFTECTPTNISPLDFSSVDVSSDFKGGLLNSTTSTSSAQSSPISSITEQKSEKSLLITAKPSQTSKCFENTFKLLQTQLECNAKKAVSVMQSFNVDTSFLNSSICSLPSISESEEPPTHLELELEAMRRVRALVTNKTSYNISPRFVALLCDFISKGQHKEDEKDYREICSKDGEQDLRYHAAKNCDGKNCLKVIRTLCSEKVLCGNRVSQMTRAYDDIEAVTRLLEEKEKDLELTVQIGKELLTQNNALESRITELEADLKSSNEDRAQLVHELHKKNELIAVLTNDSDEGSENDTPTFSKSITLDLLQKKIATLQDENKSLKLEALQLASETDDVEAQERQLMEDITSQLNEANGRYDSMNLELERLREENRLQHEQIISLTARLSEAEMRLHQLTHDNDEHITLLNITKENQNSLAVELLEFKQRYQEVLALLQEAQEQLRNQRKKTMPQARSSFISNSGLLQPESLQSELMESSMYSENSLDSGISGDTLRADRMGRLMSQMPGIYGGGAGAAGSAYGFGGVGAIPPYKRVFETVRCASKTGNYMDSGNSSMTQLGAMAMSSSVGPRMSAMPYRGAAFDDNTMGLKTLSCESLASQSDDGYPAAPSGVPGAPGAKDLEAALKRLTPAEVLARRAMLSYAPVGTYSYDEQPTTTNTLPLGVRTPDSIMSTGSSGISSSNMSASMQQWRLPEKLQIVKPIEGSQTLHHWSRLATPTLSGLLEERPGVTIRGGRGLDDLGMQVYTLSDVEEDVSDDLPGKQFEASGCTFTYTTSMVMHPDDGLNDLSFLSQSQLSSRMASASTSRQPSCPPTPHGGLSRKNSCSTFSVNLGLASMLNERGIKAVTPSALNTPAGPNFTPTVTPCNSPEGSPPRSASPEPLFGILSTGADLIRRKLIGDIERPNRNQAQKQQKIMLSRLERRALRSLKLVEKVESIGLENIIVAQPNTMSQLASGIASRSSSPMAQLISLKNLHTCANNVVDDIHFDRDQIKTVLHKGLTTPTTTSSCIRSDDESVETESISSVISTERTVKNGQQHIVINSTQNVIAATVTATPTNGTSTTESRIKQLQRQKSRRNLKNGIAGQRPDLGTINGSATGGGSGRVRPDLGKVSSGPSTSAAAKSNMTNAPTDVPQTKKSAHNKERGPREQQEGVLQTVVGTVSSLLFGRKGGWL